MRFFQNDSIHKIVSPNELAKNEESFTAITKWSPKIGVYLLIYARSPRPKSLHFFEETDFVM